MLPKVSASMLSLCTNAQGNKHDGAHFYMPDGAFVALNCWPTMWDKMQRAGSAQAENDRAFYRSNIPEETKVLVRITRREVVKKEDGKVLLKSVDEWLQADGLISFLPGFAGVELTEEGKVHLNREDVEE